MDENSCELLRNPFAKQTECIPEDIVDGVATNLCIGVAALKENEASLGGMRQREKFEF
jgi:hypothetical protein